MNPFLRYAREGRYLLNTSKVFVVLVVVFNTVDIILFSAMRHLNQDLDITNIQVEFFYVLRFSIEIQHGVHTLDECLGIEHTDSCDIVF